MKRENKVVSILAASTLAFSGAAFGIRHITTKQNELDFKNVADYIGGNTATYFVFSTQVSVSFEGEKDKEMYSALKEINEKLNYLHDLGSPNEDVASLVNLYDINRMSVDSRIKINEELYKILNDTKTLYNYSNGIFDPNAGKLYNFLKNQLERKQTGAAPINAAELASHTTNGKWSTFDEALLLEEINGEYFATRKHPDVSVDLGGYLKGYATEYIRTVANRYNRNIFVNAGASSMSFIGNYSDTPSNGRKIILGSPRVFDENGNGCSFGTEAVCLGYWKESNNFHVSSSGDYIQGYVDSNGDRWHHLVDPRDGRMVQDRGMVSITSADKTSYLDALSTILFIENPSNYATLLSKFDEKINVVYGTTKPDDSDIDKMTYIGSDSEVRFVINDNYR